MLSSSDARGADVDQLICRNDLMTSPGGIPGGIPHYLGGRMYVIPTQSAVIRLSLSAILVFEEQKFVETLEQIFEDSDG